MRQEDPLWAALHRGVLTTGYLAQTLGFFEPLSARKLGIPKSQVSHRLLLEACARLVLPPHSPSPDAGRAAAAAGGLSATPVPAGGLPPAGAAAAETQAEQHNAAAVARFNAEKLGPQVAGAVPPEGAAAGGKAEQQLPWLGDPAVLAWAAAPAPALAAGGNKRKKKGRKKTKNGQQAGKPGAAGARLASALGSAAELDAVAAAGAAAAASAGHTAAAGSAAAPTGAAPAADARQAAEALKLRQARSLAQQGHLAICCAWGKAQEAASLLALARVLPPGAVLAEVGLCQLGPQDLPQEWGFAPGSLPPLGASPDALLRYAALGGAPAAEGQLPLPSLASAGQPPDGLLRLSRGPGLDTEPPQPSAALLGEGLGGAAAASSSGPSVVEVVEVKNVCPFGVNQRRCGVAL